MSSSLAWLDQDDAQRQRMREAVALFRQEGAVDELGLGRIRDALSDRLFPGTSVLWSRARYLLFVPWLFQLLEERAGRPGSPEDRARKLQKRLARALNEAARAGDDPGESGLGIIGALGGDVRQTPDMIMWASLERWGVRLVPGSMVQSRREAVTWSEAGTFLSEQDAPLDDIWHPRLPPKPDAFPDEAAFALSEREAGFLADLLDDPEAASDSFAQRRRDSLLPVLLRAESIDLRFPWSGHLSGMSAPLSDAVRRAGAFSTVMHGARLLYAQLVAEARGDARAEEMLEALNDNDWPSWVADMEARGTQLQQWADELDVFWQVVAETNPNISKSEREFVAEWADIALAGPESVGASAPARSLIIERENRVKGSRKSRLALGGGIGRDAPATIPAPMNFRWGVAHSILTDIRRGLPA